MKEPIQHTIISHGMDDCYELISLVGKDEKTRYVDGDCFKIVDGISVYHRVETLHNIRNFKRKFNAYELLTKSK
jgi:hypothetical protein